MSFFKKNMPFLLGIFLSLALYSCGPGPQTKKKHPKKNQSLFGKEKTCCESCECCCALDCTSFSQSCRTGRYEN